MIAVPPVAIVISAWISEPVASVAMNESIRITTTTTALTRPTSNPVPSPSTSAGTSGTPTARKCAVTTPVSVIA
jgi:hypothetical protein